MRVSHDSDPTSGHEPCPKPLPNPNPRTDVLRHIRAIEPVPTAGPAWLLQRKASGCVGHPVERYGLRALFNVAPQTQTKHRLLCELMQPIPIPTPTPIRRSADPPIADPAAPLLLFSRSSARSPIKTAASSAFSRHVANAPGALRDAEG